MVVPLEGVVDFPQELAPLGTQTSIRLGIPVGGGIPFRPLRPYILLGVAPGPGVPATQYVVLPEPVSIPKNMQLDGNVPLTV